MRSRFVAVAAAAAIVVNVFGVGGGGASAAESRTVYLARDVTNPADTHVHPLPDMVVRFTVGAGRHPVLLTGQVTALALTKSNVLQSAPITCTAPDGRTAFLMTDRNNEGYDAYGGAPLQVLVRFLYRPAAAGTHACTLGVQSHAAADPTSGLRVLKGTATYLTYSLPMPRAIAFSTALDRYDSEYSPVCPGDLPCGSATHLGRNAADQYLPAGTSEAVAVSPVYTASSAATGLALISDISLTVCYANTSSCPAYAFGAASSWAAGSTVVARLVVLQLGPYGRTCTRTALPWRGYTITTNAHHQKLYFTMPSFTFSAVCGASHRVRTYVELAWLSGNPVRVEPQAYRTTGIFMERSAG